MHTRRTHRKSRLGCMSCKQRRVKCDEAGPPCGNCRARGEKCLYPSNDICFRHTSISKEAATAPEGYQPHPRSPGLPHTREILELQLMHRWTTCTYKSMPKVTVGEECTWQLVVPEMSLTFEFLRNGLFAIAAFETATICANDTQKYVGIALDYQDVAIQTFQAQLCDVSTYSEEASLYFSVMLLVLSFASAQSRSFRQNAENDATLQDTLAHFELMRGVRTMMSEAKDQRIKSLLLPCRWASPERDVTLVDPMWKVPLHKMSHLIDTHCQTASQAIEKAVPLSDSYAASCMKALSRLGECVAICSKVTDLDNCLRWPCRLSPDYILGIKHRDPTALVILMHWAILGHKLESYRWWIKDYGRSLILEISNLLMPHANSLMKELVFWARNQL